MALSKEEVVRDLLLAAMPTLIAGPQEQIVEKLAKAYSELLTKVEEADNRVWAIARNR